MSVIGVVGVLCLTGCLGSKSGSSSPSTSASVTPTPSATISASASASATPAAASSPAGCPNPKGGDCLGQLAAGSYHTEQFEPRLGYTVPAGWGNLEDNPGNFLLIPPKGSLAGVDPGTSDYIGVYSGIAAGSSDCTTAGAAPEVGTTPAKIAAHWSILSTVTTTKPKPVTVGGLHGVMVDVTPNLSVKACTDPSSSYGYQSLIAGVGPASVNHGMVKGLHLRVYLLTVPDGSTLAIEIDDVHGGKSIAAYSKIATALTFGK